MAGSDKTVKVTLVAVATPYAKGMTEASVATRKLGSEIEGVSSKTKGLEAGAGRASGALKGLAIGAGAVAATGLVAFLTDSVKAAGDLQQSVGGVEAVFKSNTATIKAFGETAAESVGLSTNEFNKLVTISGSLLKNKGLTDFTDKALLLVKVGADLAAQFGGTTAEAVNALNSAMRGEYEMIERYGMSLSEVQINSDLAAKGLGDLKGQALEAAKAQSRIDLLLGQSADAAGAFAREAGTLQGQQQRLNAEWANAKAELGTALLPALTDVTSALRSGVDVVVAAGHAWEEIPGPIKAAIAALVIYKLTNDKVASGLGSARDAIRRMREELALQQALAGGISGGYQRLGDEAQTAGKKVSRAAGAMGVASKAARGAGSALMGAFGGPIGLAITGLTVAIGVFASRQAEAKARVEELTDQIDLQTGALKENAQENLRNQIATGEVGKTAQKLGISLQDVFEAAQGGADAMARINDVIRELNPTTDEYTKTITRGATANAGLKSEIGTVLGFIQQQRTDIDGATEAAKRKAAITVEGAGAEQGYGNEVDATTGKVKEQADAIRDAAKAVLEGIEAKQQAFDSEIAYQGALDDTAAAIRENGRTAKKGGAELDLNTEAGRENARALSDLASAAKAKSEADIESGASLKTVRDGMKDARAEFIDNAVKMGLSKEAAARMATEFGLSKKEVDKLAESVKDLPASKQIVIEAETKAAAERLAALKRQLDGIKSKSVVVTATTRYVNTGPLPNGGRSTAGGSTFADGGSVRGAGTGTSDSIPAWLSNGEYVVRAAAVAKYGTGLLDHINAMRFADGGSVRYGSRQVVQVPSGPSSHAVTNDSRLMAEQVTIVTPSPGAFRREIRTAPYRAKARPGR